MVWCLVYLFLQFSFSFFVKWKWHAVHRAAGDAPSAGGPCGQGGEDLSVQGQELHALAPAPVPCPCQRRMPVFASSQPFRGCYLCGSAFSYYLLTQDEVPARLSQIMLTLITRLCLPAPSNILANEVSAGMLANATHCVWVLQNQ